MQLQEADYMDRGDFTVWKVLKFYIPLFIQIVSQSLTYPLVASIVSHGKLGSNGLGAFAQGITVMSVFGAVGTGIITTGMVFGKTKTGYENYKKLVYLITIAICSLQLLLCLPPLHHILFNNILKLNGELAHVGRWTLLMSIPCQVAFFLRNNYQAVLYNKKLAGFSNAATMIRIIINVALSPLFVKLGFTGYIYGSIAMSLPVFVEVYLSRVFALPHIKQLTDSPFDERAPMFKQLRFTIPLSFGGMMLSLSSLVVAVFIGRTRNPETTFTIHYIVMGISAALGDGALRMQALVIGFPPRHKNDTFMIKFAWASGLVLALISFTFQIPAVSQWYFGNVQNLSSENIILAKKTMLCIFLLPLLQSLRGYAEGKAALRRRPNAIMSGQIMYLATIVSVLFILLNTGFVPDHMMGVVSILCSLSMALVAVYIGLIRVDFEDSYGNPSGGKLPVG